jgi:hypothetical protein
LISRYAARAHLLLRTSILCRMGRQTPHPDVRDAPGVFP